ncbi:unnamed protein product [marine sediment metagenome]|uniref:Uncharacterized protein n=1 Tax=marine sediment metagenome TaxID=412755 RepID=X1M5T0_9ZZZZ
MLLVSTFRWILIGVAGTVYCKLNYVSRDARASQPLLLLSQENTGVAPVMYEVTASHQPVFDPPHAAKQDRRSYTPYLLD